MNNCSKTDIMYKSNLSFAQLKEYLSFLLETKLIISITQSDRKGYGVTPKGMKFLQSYAKIRVLLKTDGEHEGKNNSLNFFKDGNCYKTRN